MSAAPVGGPRMALARAAAAVRNAAGWRAWGMLVVAGGLSALAFPPLHLVPLALLAFPVLALSLCGAPSSRAAFARGWWFGVGHFGVGLEWVVNAFLVDPQKYAMLAPLALFALATGLALFPAVAGVATGWATRRGRLAPAGTVALLAATWGATEWLRGWVLTGFPWNPMSSIWSVSDATLQPLALVGTYALSTLTVFIAASPAALAGRGRGRLAVPVTALVLVAAFWGGGAIRLAGADAGTVDGVRLRLVQPDIDQRLKWKPDLRLKHVLDQVEMSRRPDPKGKPPTDVIWAETNAPFLLSNAPEVRRLVGEAAPPGGLALVGAPRMSRKDGLTRYYNSLFVIAPDGHVVATYDKSHLVPFGEYVPFRKYLPFPRLVESRGDFTPGPGPVVLHLPGLPPVSPLICYEAIFSGHVTPPGERPAWLLNITNDAWFGTSSGPYQHFVQARMRAVEEGLPLVRVANTGISAIVDPYGRVVRSLALGARGIVDGPLPKPLAATPFAAWGNLHLLYMVAFLVVMAGFCRPEKRENGNNMSIYARNI